MKSKYLRIGIATHAMEKTDIGYCISTIDNDNKGEIDSIFIEKQYRKEGIGKKLVETAVNWLKSKGAVGNSIYVAFGNEEVIDFYKSFGFYPRNVHLAQREK